MSRVVVVVEVEGDDVARIAAQIPRAETLGAGTRVVVAGKAKGWLGKILGARGGPPLHAMGSALLARGYVAIGAGEDEGRIAAWGEAPSEGA
jgi:hypothetical protein